MSNFHPKDFLSDLIDLKKLNYSKEYNKAAKIHKYWSRKPWYLIQDHVLRYSKIDDVVLDPFMGSGTVGLEAILNHRSFIGYDLNPSAVFLSDSTISDLDFDAHIFDLELSNIKDNLYKKVMDLYEVNSGRYILYHVSGDVKNLDFNTVTVNYDLKDQKKITLSNELLNLSFTIDLPYPDQEFPSKFYKDRFSYKGYKSVSDFYTSRNLKALTIIFNYLSSAELKYKKYFLLAFSNTLLHVSKLKGLNVRPLGVNNYWIPDDNIQENVIWRFLDRAQNILTAKKILRKRFKEKNVLTSQIPKFTLYNKSSLELTEITSASIDYIITDPPYGDAIQYSELSFIWNCWLGKEYLNNEEVIINPVQNKGLFEFHSAIAKFIRQTNRVLKENACFTLCFQNKDLNIWFNILKEIKLNNFELVDVKIYETLGNPYNKNWAKFSPKSDLYVTFKKGIFKSNENNSKKIDIGDLILEIKNLMASNSTLFDLNKAYDLLVASLIHYEFNDYSVSGVENLNLKKIIALFDKDKVGGIIQKGNTSNIQTKLRL